MSKLTEHFQLNNESPIYLARKRVVLENTLTRLGEEPGLNSRAYPERDDPRIKLREQVDATVNQMYQVQQDIEDFDWARR